MSLSKIPASLHVPAGNRIHWYPSHMARGLEKIKQKLATVDLILEVRDARIPVTSRNPKLDALCAGIPKLVIYNKSDLSDDAFNQSLQNEPNSILLNNKSPNYQFVNQIKSLLKNINGRDRRKMMVIGIPNVGKSTILNRLRAIGCDVGGGKAVKVGNLPGVTRSVSNLVRVLDKPLTYVYDTPGILLPRLSNPAMALKLALTGAIASTQFSEYTLVEYLLKVFNSKGNFQFTEFYGIDREEVTDLDVVLQKAAYRLGNLLKGGQPNTLLSAQDFISRFRAGKFGKMTLDDRLLPP
jgi:mitochondrial GTPase 1